MMNHAKYGFSAKDLCIRPRQPGAATRSGTPLFAPAPASDVTADLAAAAAADLQRAVNKVEQQVRDALFARTTAHIGEARVLKNAFAKFDKDLSGEVEYEEFSLALEHLGLHTEEEGLRGEGGLSKEVVEALFARYDTSGDGKVSFQEFSAALLAPDKEWKML